MEVFENMAFVSNGVTLVTYFNGYMNFSLTKSANTLTNYMGTSFLLTLVGGVISDAYLSRFKTCVLFGCIELLGYALLTVQAHFKQLRPFPCKGVAPSETNHCKAAAGSQAAILFSALYLIALGTSGAKAALPSLGVDQFDDKDHKEAAQQASFFNWFYFSLISGSMFAVTFLVWISNHQGWQWAFFTCTISVFTAILFLCTGKSFYQNNVPKGSPLVRILQVFVATFRNRNLPIPDMADELNEVDDKDAGIGIEILQRTCQLWYLIKFYEDITQQVCFSLSVYPLNYRPANNFHRFLDRAAIVRSTGSKSASATPGPWSMCTVTQVEETKILIHMLPIALSTVFLNTCVAQLQTFSIKQSITMDTCILGFRVPGPSIPVIPLLFVIILIPAYDRIFIPVARKLTGIPTGITHLQQIGVGLVLSAISMAVSALVESRRKSVAIEHNMVYSTEPLPINVLWLGFQYVIFEEGEIFTFVGLIEFFYEESSLGMKSLCTAVPWCTGALGYFSSTVVVQVVNKVSGGWLASNNLNVDKLNYFYWLLSGLSMVNFGVYLACASWYKYKKVEVKPLETSGADDVEGEI